jgi:hypothetical protein
LAWCNGVSAILAQRKQAIKGHYGSGAKNHGYAPRLRA